MHQLIRYLRRSLALALAAAPLFAQGSLPLHLVSDPALSPDGATLVISWGGDLWSAPSAGGAARPLTTDSAREREPNFSPDGKRLAYSSDRDGSFQIYVMDSDGGAAQQITFHTAGYSLVEWFPDGKSFLAISSRDNYWDDSRRFFRVFLPEASGAGVEREPRRADELLFDDYGSDGSLSPDGNQLLFVREGPSWWRKGYHGSQSAQIWMFDLTTRAFSEIHRRERGARSPRWMHDGKGFYYCGEQGGNFNLYSFRFDTRESTPITDFADDAVVTPALARKAQTLVFRQLFDLYRMDPNKPGSAVRLAINAAVQHTPEREVRRSLSEASEAAYSADGLEIAFIAGGDVYVMDTELREPRQLTNTSSDERSLAFAPDGETIVFASDREGEGDLWSARRGDAQKYWWQNERFELSRLTQDPQVDRNAAFSPDGSRIAFVRGLGDLWTMKSDGSEAQLVLAGRDDPDIVSW
jgi:Tol biopolymer transport system component